VASGWRGGLSPWIASGLDRNLPSTPFDAGNRLAEAGAPPPPIEMTILTALVAHLL